jgi:hypothetical protein
MAKTGENVEKKIPGLQYNLQYRRSDGGARDVFGIRAVAKQMLLDLLPVL